MAVYQGNFEFSQQEEFMVELWAKHQCLYDTTQKGVHNKTHKDNAYAAIGRELGISAATVKMKMDSLRSNYGRELRLVQDGDKSGTPYVPSTRRKQWILEVCSFLEPYITRRTGEQSSQMKMEQGDMTAITPHHLRNHHKHHHKHHNPQPHRPDMDNDNRCPTGEFLTYVDSSSPVCRPCSVCAIGSGVSRACNARQDTVCEECHVGKSYLRDYFGLRRCFKCRTCVNRSVVKECTATSNTVCGKCSTGYFHDELTEKCIACSYCYPDVPGYGIVEPMCSTQHGQPADYTCLPSFPPVHLRTTTAAPTRHETTMENWIERLDKKLGKLGRRVTNELNEVRDELDAMRTELKNQN